MSRPKLNVDGEHAFKARFPVETWQALEAAAAADHRSINAEIVWMVQQQLALKKTSRRGRKAQEQPT